jgi:hypothetical protein
MSEMATYRQLPPLGYNSPLRLNTMAGFDEAWMAVNRSKGGESVSPELRPLLRRIYFDVLAAPVDLVALKKSLCALLEYLTDNGRTKANCWAVGLFFCTSDGWARDWTEQDLPDDFQDVLSLMGQALHDTIEAPNIVRISIVYLSNCLIAFGAYNFQVGSMSDMGS